MILDTSSSGLSGIVTSTFTPRLSLDITSYLHIEDISENAYPKIDPDPLRASTFSFFKVEDLTMPLEILVR